MTAIAHRVGSEGSHDGVGAVAADQIDIPRWVPPEFRAGYRKVAAERGEEEAASWARRMKLGEPPIALSALAAKPGLSIVEQRMLDLRKRGQSISTIAGTEGVAESTVVRTFAGLRERGIDIPASQASSATSAARDGGWAWTEDRISDLRRLFRDGLSASQIAIKMQAPSRKTIIGKMQRLGLKQEDAPASPPQEKRRPQARTQATASEKHVAPMYGAVAKPKTGRSRGTGAGPHERCGAARRHHHPPAPRPPLPLAVRRSARRWFPVLRRAGRGGDAGAGTLLLRRAHGGGGRSAGEGEGAVKPEDKLLRYAAERAESLIAGCVTGFRSRGTESPIERLFLASFHTVVKFGERRFKHVMQAEKRSGSNEAILYLALQERVLDWRVDFAIYVRDPFKDRETIVVVECDGHDFHERTKEQASRDRSRDRALTSAGIAIFRFTGSELWRDPARCAEQVVDHCDEIWEKAIAEEDERVLR